MRTPPHHPESSSILDWMRAFIAVAALGATLAIDLAHVAAH